jgi:hypothetical protein
MDQIGTDNHLTLREFKIALFGTKHGFLLLFGLFFGGVSAAFGIHYGIKSFDEHRILQSGSPTMASIVEKRMRSDSGEHGMHYSYYMTYEFRTADRHPYRNEISVSGQTYNETNEGDRISIYYDPKDPSKIAVPGETTNPWLLPLLALFTAIGGTAFVAGVRGVRRKLKLFGRGMATLGKNLGIRFDYSMQVNNEPSTYLQFEYVDFQGAKRECRSSYLNEKQSRLLKDMSEVPVVYLPEAPDSADLDFDKIEEKRLLTESALQER